jgi:hypothetical protein
MSYLAAFVLGLIAGATIVANVGAALVIIHWPIPGDRQP